MSAYVIRDHLTRFRLRLGLNVLDFQRAMKGEAPTGEPIEARLQEVAGVLGVELPPARSEEAR